MTCAAFAASGSNTVMDLTGRRIEKVDKELRIFSVKQWLGGFVASVFENMAAKWFDSLAVKFTDDAIWFKGVATESWNENIDFENHLDAVYPRLEKLKVSLLAIRKEMLEIQQSANASSVMKMAAARVVSSAVDLFDSIEAFKWTLMELQANHSPRSEGYFADTPEGVAELFRRISQEA